MEPFVKYPGGKSKELPLVIKYKPENISRYFEPFVGGGAIYFGISIEDSFINDKSFDLYNLYLLIKNQDNKLKKHLANMDAIWRALDDNIYEDLIKENGYDLKQFKKFYESAKKRKDTAIKSFEDDGIIVSDEDKKETIVTARKTAFYMLVRKLYNNNTKDLPLRAALFYFLREYCYSSMFRFSKTGEFNVPYGGMSYNKKYLSQKAKRMFSKEMSDYLSNTIIDNLDFEEFLNKYDLGDKDFIFLDPPYDSDFSTYDKNVFDKSEQIRLRDVLRNTQAKWMLIIKRTDFIYDLYKDFHIYEYDKNYFVSFKNRNNKEVKHLMITNYEVKENGRC